jgi:hypothetical protein
MITATIDMEKDDAEIFFGEVSLFAINPLVSDHPKSLDLISICLSGLMISVGNLRLLKYASVVDK